VSLPHPIHAFNESLAPDDQAICKLLSETIQLHLGATEAKIWHAHPVWFIAGNPIVGYSKQKAGIRLMFWSGADFDTDTLPVQGSKFKDASRFYQNVGEIDVTTLIDLLGQAQKIQWDYKNLIKRKGKLERLV
jgi:hypothetical protein